MNQILRNFAAISKTINKCYLLFIFLLFFSTTFGQNAIAGAGFTNGWPSSCSSNTSFVYFSSTAGTTMTSGDLTPKGIGSQYWRLATDYGGTMKTDE